MDFSGQNCVKSSNRMKKSPYSLEAKCKKTDLRNSRPTKAKIHAEPELSWPYVEPTRCFACCQVTKVFIVTSALGFFTRHQLTPFFVFGHFSRLLWLLYVAAIQSASGSARAHSKTELRILRELVESSWLELLCVSSYCVLIMCNSHYALYWPRLEKSW